ncbi:MAG TPA: hypothetical protein VMX35_03075 [Acidobacteriota bacterium]|nr:hypothetical protein [Acidobacteriota bacterium]
MNSLIVVCLFLFTTWFPPLATPSGSVVIRSLDRHSGDVAWSPDGEWIAYSKTNTDGDCYKDIWIVHPDATGHRCLSSRWTKKKSFPHRQAGGVTWHVSGDYLVFVAQNNDAVGKRLEELATPGTGLNCNLWLTSVDDSRVWQLTFYETSTTRPRGVIHPQFSPDGRTLVWAEALGKYPKGDAKVYQWGKWAIKSAELEWRKNGPVLKNIRKYCPGRQKVFYETHGFSPDGSKILYCANSMQGQPLNGIDIWSLDLQNGRSRRLTRTRSDWDEHAHYSPDGSMIAWASGAGFDVEFPTLRSPDWKQYVQLDVWAMNADGSGMRRITFFNEDGHPDSEWFRNTVYDSPRIVVSDSDWSPDGQSLVLTLAYEGPDKAMGSFLLLIDMAERLAR